MKGMHLRLAASKYQRGMAARQGPVTGGSVQKPGSTSTAGAAASWAAGRVSGTSTLGTAGVEGAPGVHTPQVILQKPPCIQAAMRDSAEGLRGSYVDGKKRPALGCQQVLRVWRG